jgi:nicotinate dehydrogenase subunit B
MIANQKEVESSPTDVFGASLSRRGFVKAGGALLVGFSLASADSMQKTAAAVSGNTLNPALVESWIEIHADNTILVRVGKPDFGTGTVFTAYRQIVAEELSVSFESITTVVSGDTDRTPDGSGAFDFLGRGMPNVRNAARFSFRAARCTKGSALRERRYCLRRRQELVLWRPGQEPEVEPHDTC